MFYFLSETLASPPHLLSSPSLQCTAKKYIFISKSVANKVIESLFVNIDKLVNLGDYCTLVLAYVALGETLRSKDGIGVQKSVRHLTAKCATTFVLVGSTIQLCSNQQESFVRNEPPNLAQKYIPHFVIFNRSRFTSLSMVIKLRPEDSQNID